MRLPSITRVATILILILGLSGAATAATPPDAVLREFYKWYINAIDGGSDPFTKGKATLKRYVTLRLINQIHLDENNGLDADEFLQTQDMDKAWAEAVNVSKLSTKGSTATAIVTFGTKSYPRISVTLVKQTGIWKIDRVKDASR